MTIAIIIIAALALAVIAALVPRTPSRPLWKAKDEE